ncbi:hypothetical protein C9374_009647 [Naegleria lovaniensis]|uniref:Uncharacterized protein n=1 Tax=Naegleria lovaniensis TaxID=51637 RepID=A0AA88KX62_NAELO|nr:uncharacterized protein C9374_009647 [Naegleria lovaniensis]KAG2393070.1 hypothetical protein C9374_009647 [Naegleria lovaniensis]
MPKKQQLSKKNKKLPTITTRDSDDNDGAEIHQDIPTNNNHTKTHKHVVDHVSANSETTDKSSKTIENIEELKKRKRLSEDKNEETNELKKVKFEESEEDEDNHSDENDDEAIIEASQHEPPQNRQPGLTDEDTKKELSKIITEILNRQVTRDKSPHLTTELPLLINSKAKTYQRFMEFMQEERQQKSTEKQRRKLLSRNYQPPLLSDWEKEKSLSNVATQGIVKLLNAVLQKKRESIATMTNNGV